MTMLRGEIGDEPTPEERKRWRTALSKGAVGLVGLFLLLTSFGGFCSGLATYFYDSTEGIVVASNFSSSKKLLASTSGWGDITFEVDIAGRKVQHESSVRRSWLFNGKKRFGNWETRYAVGSTVPVFYNAHGNVSLGHWPMEDDWILPLWGLLFMVVGVVNIRGSLKQSASGKPLRTLLNAGVEDAAEGVEA